MVRITIGLHVLLTYCFTVGLFFVKIPTVNNNAHTDDALKNNYRTDILSASHELLGRVIATIIVRVATVSCIAHIMNYWTGLANCAVVREKYWNQKKLAFL